MEEFYQKAQGVLALVIRHNGTTFDYVNGYKNNEYFSNWKHLTPMMEAGHFYCIACQVLEGRGKAKLVPIGIADKFENEKEAKDFSFGVKKSIETGTWDGEFMGIYLKQFCKKFYQDWMRDRLKVLDVWSDVNCDNKDVTRL